MIVIEYTIFIHVHSTGFYIVLIKQWFICIPENWKRFLPRDAMHKRGLCRHAVSVCLSVRPSVTFVDHIKTNKHIFEFFSPRVATAFWFFHTKGGADIPTGTPPQLGRRMQVGYRQKLRFWSNSWLSKIAGRAKCQKHLPTTKLSIWHSRPRTTGYRSIAGCANYEVTKTVTDDHAV